MSRKIRIFPKIFSLSPNASDFSHSRQYYHGGGISMYIRNRRSRTGRSVPDVAALQPSKELRQLLSELLYSETGEHFQKENG
jgi:hypothetical protein